MPLSIVLGDMEYVGIRVDKSVLNSMNTEIEGRIKEISEKIYELAGEKFNISSPRQLGEILFVKLEIGKGKKTKTVIQLINRFWKNIVIDTQLFL